MKSRKLAWKILEGDSRGSRVFGLAILLLIALNVLAVILESIRPIREAYGQFFATFETVSVSIFTAEYLVRLWCCTVHERYRKPLWGRLRFACAPRVLIDLLAFLPFYLPFLGVDLRYIRLLRVLRVFRILKMGRYYTALDLIVAVLRSRREELLMSLALMGALLIVSSSLMYSVENAVQPDKFPNIPATMWWAVSTLTTVGYGDVYPVTGTGRALAGTIAAFGIGMFALPAGILGSGFVEEIQRRRKSGSRKCPHCGRELE